jgi:uncharacterized protein YaaQ
MASMEKGGKTTTDILMTATTTTDDDEATTMTDDKVAKGGAKIFATPKISDRTPDNKKVENPTKHNAKVTNKLTSKSYANTVKASTTSLTAATNTTELPTKNDSHVTDTTTSKSDTKTTKVNNKTAKQATKWMIRQPKFQPRPMHPSWMQNPMARPPPPLQLSSKPRT